MQQSCEVKDIQICIGSSCRIKGSSEIVELLTKATSEYGLENEGALSGSVCIGQCNRFGVTVHAGIHRVNFNEFLQTHVLSVFGKEGK